MAEPAVTFLLDNVQKLLVDHINLISGAESELRQLQNELELMKAFLIESANKREKGEVFRQHERQIREVVYKAEDTLDACLTQAAADKSKPTFSLKNLNPKRYDLAKKVKALREQDVQPIFDRARLGLATLPMATDPSSAGAEKPKNEDKKDAQLPFMREDRLMVGFEDDKKAIIKYLNEETEELDVISIVGMAGLGKTTLAWKIYGDPRIKHQFPFLIWIYVSQDFDMKNVFLTILEKFTHEDMSKLTNSLLADIVRNNLENQKFLLFIDGVETTEDWRLIEVALPKSNRFGKVLITTQNQQVAQEANCKREPYCLSFLTPQESWELLQLQVFGKLDECPLELEELGKRVAMKCQGLPLAIVVIGGTLIEKLSTRHVMAEWENVLSSLSTYLHHDVEKRIAEIIALSYNKLPYELRDCFLYLGVFPQDTEIPAWKVVRLWIAEGFIQPKSGKSLEEAAEDNLKELVGRNLVMVEKTKAGGGIKTCRLSNIMHDFCTSKSAYADLNLFQEVKKSADGVFHPPISEIQDCRRLCIHSYVVDFVSQKPKTPHVRSFLCFSREEMILPYEFTSAIPNAFNLLRVLDVNPIKFLKLPLKFSRLLHLRYIALSGDEFKALPSMFLKLWNLQTIRINTKSRILEIKADIWKMICLRHLKTKAAIVLTKEAKGGGGENLQTLTRLSTQSFSKDICERAFNLKNLGIRGDLGTLVSTRYMAGLDRLQKLKLVHDAFPRPENQLSCLPRPDAFPPNLRILELSYTYLEWKHSGTLGMLPTLEILKLKARAFVGSLWEVGDGLFPSLEFLLIERTNLEVWNAKDSFPRLRCLVLKNCETLQEIPRVLAKSIQVLDIERVPKSVIESAKEIKKEKLQMQDLRGAKRGEFKLNICPGDEV